MSAEPEVVNGPHTFVPDRVARQLEAEGYRVELGGDPTDPAALRAVAHGLRMCAREIERLRAERDGLLDERYWDKPDAERWRFVRGHYTWLRRVDDDGVEQTYLEVRMPLAANLSCAGMCDDAVDRLAKQEAAK